jgi:hypothetical protein
MDTLPAKSEQKYPMSREGRPTDGGGHGGVRLAQAAGCDAEWSYVCTNFDPLKLGKPINTAADSEGVFTNHERAIPVPCEEASLHKEPFKKRLELA